MAFRWMCLDLGELTFDYGGEKPYCCPASTGRIGATDPAIGFVGPIPPGEYIIDPHADHYTHVEGYRFLLRRARGDWGHYRVKLVAHNVPNEYGRDDFYLHGGEILGSAGCIDVGKNERKLFELIEATNANDGTDDILVKVTDTPNITGWEYLGISNFTYISND